MYNYDAMSQEELQELAQKHENSYIRVNAVRKLENQEGLETIALNNEIWIVRVEAIKK